MKKTLGFIGMFMFAVFCLQAQQQEITSPHRFIRHKAIVSSSVNKQAPVVQSSASENLVVPVSAVQASTVSVQAVPVQAVPVQAVPVQAVPVSTINPVRAHKAGIQKRAHVFTMRQARLEIPEKGKVVLDGVPPVVQVPAVQVPAVQVPAVQVPTVSVPAVPAPTVSVPAVSVPTVSASAVVDQKKQSGEIDQRLAVFGFSFAFALLGTAGILFLFLRYRKNPQTAVAGKETKRHSGTANTGPILRISAGMVEKSIQLANNRLPEEYGPLQENEDSERDRGERDLAMALQGLRAKNQVIKLSKMAVKTESVKMRIQEAKKLGTGIGEFELAKQLARFEKKNFIEEAL